MAERIGRTDIAEKYAAISKRAAGRKRRKKPENGEKVKNAKYGRFIF